MQFRRYPKDRLVWRRGSLVVVVVAMLLVAPGTALGQKKKKDAKAGTAAEEQQRVIPVTQTPDAEQIESLISEMLAGWQIGDTEIMRKAYADGVMVVSGLYEPPIVGWTNYLNAYQRLLSRLQTVRKDRFNTFTVVRGNVAWSTFQWQMNALVDARPTVTRGHTTLVLERIGGRWHIVHDHTSVVSDTKAEPAPASPATPPPAKPPGD
jgi:ketosteroid isomerase-like protein